MKRKSDIQFGVGGSSILMIFVILCLTTFGILSFVTANADYKISAKNAETVKNYYKAYAEAQTRLQQIDGALLDAGKDAEQAVKENTCERIKNKALYPDGVALSTIYTSGLSAEQKHQAFYRLFAQILTSKNAGVTFEETQTGDGLNGFFTCEADRNRQIRMELTVNPYGSAELYRITGEKLVNASASQPQEEEKLQLWQGNGKQ